MSGDGQTNYDEGSPTDAPQPLARPISQEGALELTPFQVARQREQQRRRLPVSSATAERIAAIKAAEEQMGRKMTSQEKKVFKETGELPAAVAEPTPVSENVLRDEFGNLLEGRTFLPPEQLDLIEEIASAPFPASRPNLYPTAGSSGIRGEPVMIGDDFTRLRANFEARGGNTRPLQNLRFA